MNDFAQILKQLASLLSQANFFSTSRCRLTLSS
jgi:hypothetical protein